MSYASTEVADDSHFWAEAEHGRLAFQRCDDCDFLRWPAAGVCPDCLSRAFRWESVPLTGTVWSYAVYHRAYSDATRARVPYNVALVELDCGARLLSTLVGFEPDQDAVGARVVARFAPMSDYPSVPVFAPADGADARD